MTQEPGPGQPLQPPMPPASPSAAPPPPPQQPTPGAWGQAPAPEGTQVPWSTPPPSSNGCLKACLIVGGILVAITILGVIALVTLGGRIVEQVQRDPDSFFGGPCTIASSYDVSDAVGESVELFELEGFVGGTMDSVLDKRLLPDAPDCYAIGQSGFVARIAVDDTGGAAAFQQARTDAEGRFLNTDLNDIGDEAFCTDTSATGSTGVLVRWGGTVAYVSVASGNRRDQDEECNLAKAVARTLGP